MDVTIEPFEHCCTQATPCGELIERSGVVLSVRRYAVKYNSVILHLSSSLAEAQQWAAKYSYEVVDAAS